MKTCTRCKQLLPLDCFGNKTESKDGKKSACKQCCTKQNHQWRRTTKGKRSHAAGVKKRRRSTKLWLLEQIGANCCSQCPENHPACLDFHHKHGKKFNLAPNMTKSKQELLEEVRKCIVLCANCHRKHHYT
jgi:hypothetical protein